MVELERGCNHMYVGLFLSPIQKRARANTRKGPVTALRNFATCVDQNGSRVTVPGSIMSPVKLSESMLFRTGNPREPAFHGLC